MVLKRTLLSRKNQNISWKSVTPFKARQAKNKKIILRSKPQIGRMAIYKNVGRGDSFNFNPETLFF